MIANRLFFAVLVVLMLAAGTVQAGGDAARGQELSVDCADCHAKGWGPGLSASCDDCHDDGRRYDPARGFAP